MKDVVNTKTLQNTSASRTSASTYLKESTIRGKQEKDKDKEEEEEERGVRLSFFWTTKFCALCAYFLPHVLQKRDLYERRWSTNEALARAREKNEEQQALLFSFKSTLPSVRLLLCYFLTDL